MHRAHPCDGLKTPIPGAGGPRGLTPSPRSATGRSPSTGNAGWALRTNPHTSALDYAWHSMVLGLSPAHSQLSPDRKGPGLGPCRGAGGACRPGSSAGRGGLQRPWPGRAEGREQAGGGWRPRWRSPLWTVPERHGAPCSSVTRTRASRAPGSGPSLPEGSL